MQILLVDADSIIPNLALMKISTYHKQLGHKVDFLKLGISYFPSRKNKIYDIPPNTLFTPEYDRIYCSVVFEGSMQYINCISSTKVIFGGTGYKINSKLYAEIENLKPDYSLYPDNEFSYGFLTRGCIRNCKFCKVPEKEGNIHQVNTIDNILHFDKVRFLDNNILALPEHKLILKELVERKIKCSFYQGLDIRLLDEENSGLIHKLNYLGYITFAFDDWSFKDIIEKKLELIYWKKKRNILFFVYCNPNMSLGNVIKRLEFIRKIDCVPYLMRDKLCYTSSLYKFYADLACYCNNHAIFPFKSFSEFLIWRRNGDKETINLHSKFTL